MSTIGLNDLADAVWSDIVNINPWSSFKDATIGKSGSTEASVLDNLAIVFDDLKAASLSDNPSVIAVNSPALYECSYNFATKQGAPAFTVAFSVAGTGVDKLFGGSDSIGLVFVKEFTIGVTDYLDPDASGHFHFVASDPGVRIDFNAGINDGTSFFGGHFNSFSFTSDYLNIDATGSIDFLRDPDTGETGVNGALSNFTIFYPSAPEQYRLSISGDIHYNHSASGVINLDGSRFSTFSISESGNHITYSGDFTYTGNLKEGHTAGSVYAISVALAGASFDLAGNIHIDESGHLSGIITDLDIHAVGTGYDARYSFAGKSVNVLDLFDVHGNMKDIDGTGEVNEHDLYDFLVNHIAGATLTGLNMSPNAVDDSGSTGNTTPLHVDAAHGVLANDTDVDGDSLVVSAVRGWEGGVNYTYSLGYIYIPVYPYYASFGTVTIHADGSYDFIPGAGSTYLASGQTVTYGIDYTVSDSYGNSSTAMLSINVTGANHSPTLSNPIADQNAMEDGIFSYTVPSNTFADVDAGDSLTYSATLSNGSLLPSWLSFNSVTHTFSGTPTNTNVGVITVKVTATDGSSTSASDEFTLTVANTNDAPTVANLIANQSATEDSVFSFAVPLNTFADADAGDTLTWSATLADGSDLPGWLSFNGVTHTFSGTPTNTNVGVITVKVTATDGSSASASDEFLLTVVNTNDAPTVAGPLVSDLVTEGDPSFNIDLLTGASDPDVGDILSVSSVTYDGLLRAPAGLTRSGKMLTVNPQSAGFDYLGDGQSRTIQVAYSVTDGHGGTVPQTATITVHGVNDAPTSTDDCITIPDAAPRVLKLTDFGFYDDPEGVDLSTVTITSLPAAGSLQYDGVDVVVDQELDAAGIVAGKLVYTPVAAMTSATIGFRVYDGTLYSTSSYALTVYAEHVVALAVGDNALGGTTVNVPEGVGAEGMTVDAGTIGDQLSAFVDSHDTSSIDASQELIHQQIDEYVAAHPDAGTVQGLSLSGGSAGDIITIDGGGTGQEVMVIDASQLPHGTVIDLNNIGFAIIIGPGYYSGGAGSNIIVADGGSQFIILGPDDDTTHGGAGNDTIGSTEGNDDLYGDEDQDLVFGGGGNDTLHGGTGDDTIAGGSVTVHPDGSHTLLDDAGNDSIDGGDGTDIIEFSGVYAGYHFGYDKATDTWTVQDTVAGHESTDTITGAEVFNFSDGNHTAAAHDCTVDVTYWKSGVGIDGVSSTITDNGNAQETAATVTGGGVYGYSGLIESDYALESAKSVGTTERNAIKVSDAMAALKIAYGLNPNGGAAVSSYQYLASDLNHNGSVQVSDAINILKTAYNLPSAPQKEWVIVDQSISNETMSRTHVVWASTGAVTVHLNQDTGVHLVGVLMGDVDGNWVA